MAGVAYAVQITDRSAYKALERVGGDMNMIRRRILSRVGESAVSYVQREKLRGQVLRRQSGHLAQGLHYVFIGPFSIFVAPSVKYGAIHEYGGVIRPVNATVLRWFNEAGDPVFAKRVIMPAKPWLGPGLGEYLKSGAAERLVERTLQEELDRISRSSRN